jgi:hypothetical protein
MPPRGTKPIRPATAANGTIVQIKNRVLATPGCKADLARIGKAGADGPALLDLLARAVAPQEEALADKVRKRQQQLKSIAGQVCTVTRHAERIANDPSFYPHLHSAFAANDADEHKKEEAALLASRWPFAAMRSYADWAERQSHFLGRWLRRNSQKERNLGVMFLLRQVHLWTDRLFADNLARLLTVASEAAGEKVPFSSSKLTKMFNRNVLDPHQKKPKKL